MSFLLDPPLLVATGAALERAPVGERATRLAGAATVALFVGVSAALYLDTPGLRRIWGPFGCAGGREFMLTSGLVRWEIGRPRRSQHVAAVALFALYPCWLALGRRLGRR